jgi:hypothetical protein
MIWMRQDSDRKNLLTHVMQSPGGHKLSTQKTPKGAVGFSI